MEEEIEQTPSLSLDADEAERLIRIHSDMQEKIEEEQKVFFCEDARFSLPQISGNMRYLEIILPQEAMLNNCKNKVLGLSDDRICRFVCICS